MFCSLAIHAFVKCYIGLLYLKIIRHTSIQLPVIMFSIMRVECEKKLEHLEKKTTHEKYFKK